jgi:LysM repeat protein
MHNKAFLIFRLVLAVLLMVAVPVATVQAASESTWHQVELGETLFSIGQLYNVSPWAIASANRIISQSQVYAGQWLYIPAGPPYYKQHRCGSYYVVQHEDTFVRIGRAHGVSAWSIAQANRIYNLNQIFAGQMLFIPCY